MGVQDLRGPVVVNDGGFDDGLFDGSSGTTLNVDDSSDSNPQAVQIKPDFGHFRGAARNLAPVSITYSDTFRLDLTVSGGGGGNTFHVASLGDENHFGPDLTLNCGSGLDTIEVIAFGYPFTMYVNGGPGNDKLTVGGFVMPRQFPNGPSSGEVDSPPDGSGSVIHYQGIKNVVTAAYGLKIPGEGDVGVGNDPIPFDAIIIGDLNGITNDTIVLRLDPNNPAFLQALVNNVVQFDGSTAGFRKIGIFSGYGNDVIDIEDIPAGLIVETIEMDTSTVNVGKAGSLQGILGTLDVMNPMDLTYLVLDDSADSTDHTVTVSNSGVRGLAPGTEDYLDGLIEYSQFDIGGLTIKGSSGSNTYNVLSTPNPGPFPIATTTIDCSGADIVNVGDANGVQDIQGFLIVNSALTDFVDLNLNDQADAIGRTVTLTSGSVSGLAPADIDYGPSALANLIVNGGTGANIFDVLSTPAPLFVRFVGVAYTNTTIDCSGADTVNVGDANGVQDIQGPLTVNSTRTDFVDLNLNDQADAIGRTVTLASGSVSGLAPADIDYGPTALANLTVNGGTGPDTFDVEGTAVATTVNAGANSVFEVAAQGQNLDAIAASLTLNGNGSTPLTIDDQFDPNQLFTQDTLTGTNLTRFAQTIDPLTGLPSEPVTTSITFGGLGGLTLNAGYFTTIVDVEGTAVATTVNAGANSVFEVAAQGQNLDAIAAPLTFVGNGATSLIIDDQLNPYGRSFFGARFYEVNDNSVSAEGSFIQFAGIQDLVLNVGNGLNYINVLGTATGTSVAVHGGSGADHITVGNNGTLDFIHGSLAVSGGGANVLTIDDKRGFRRSELYPHPDHRESFRCRHHHLRRNGGNGGARRQPRQRWRADNSEHSGHRRRDLADGQCGGGQRHQRYECP